MSQATRLEQCQWQQVQDGEQQQLFGDAAIPLHSREDATPNSIPARLDFVLERPGRKNYCARTAFD